MVKGGCPKDRVLFDPAGLFLFKERRKADSRCSALGSVLKLKPVMKLTEDGTRIDNFL